METVFSALGAQDLRRVAPLIAYWAKIGALEWDQARLQTLIDIDRVASILTTHGRGPHGPLLQRYRDYLAIRARKPVSQRTALTAAATLLAALGDAPITDLTQRHVDSTLRTRPRDRTALQAFLSFLAAEGGPKLTIANSAPGPGCSEEAASGRYPQMPEALAQHPHRRRGTRADRDPHRADLHPSPLARALPQTLGGGRLFEGRHALAGRRSVDPG